MKDIKRLIALLVFVIIGAFPLHAQQQNFGGTSSSSGASTLVVNPITYGAKFNVQHTCQATYSNANPTLTTTTADPPFTSSAVGMTVEISNGPCSGSNGAATPGTAQKGTILAVGGPNTITLSFTPSVSCTSSGTVSCEVWWGNDDTTAIQAAFSAITNVNLGIKCGTMVLPAGTAFISSVIYNATSICGDAQSLNAASTADGFTVYGQGPQATIIAPLLGFSTTNTISGCLIFCALANTAGGTGFGVSLHDYAINGMGNNSVTTTGSYNYAVFNQSVNGNTYNIIVTNWGFNSSQMACFIVGGVNEGDSVASNISCYNGGYTCGALVGSITTYFTKCFNPQDGMNISNCLATTYSMSIWGGVGGVIVTDSCPWNSNDDVIYGSLNNSAISCGSTIRMHHGTITYNSATAATNFAVGSGCALTVDNSTITSNQTNFGASAATSSIRDAGGNTFSGANSLANTTVYGSSSTGASPCLIANFSITQNGGFGTTAAVTAVSGGSGSCIFTITNSGTGQGANPTVTFTFPVAFLKATNLICTASLVGGNQTLAASNLFYSGTPSTTAVVYTYQGTPTVNDTEIVVSTCGIAN